MPRLFIFSLLIFIPMIGIGQSDLNRLATDMSYYSDIVANTSLPSTKSKANKQLVMVVEDFLQVTGSYHYQIEDPIWISVKSDEENSFKLYTWEVKSRDDFQYFGYIQYPDGLYIKLNDLSEELEDIEYMELDKETWYGALYYNLESAIDQNGNPYYIAFGIHRKNAVTTEKIAEIIHFENGELKLGKPVFKQDQVLKERLLLSYSADANVSLNYNNELNLIIFDHLISRMGNMPGQGPTQLPDGSYSGYKYEEGVWIYQDKLYDYVSDVPPRAFPEKKSDNKDLFGRVKKN